MKNVKMFLTAFAVVATVGSALAVKANFFGDGAVYCAKTSNTLCTVLSRVNFRNNFNGTSTRPCGSDAMGNEKDSYIYDVNDNCTINAKGLNYDAVGAGK